MQELWRPEHYASSRTHSYYVADETLKQETDAGMPTQCIFFGVPQSQGGDWQGVSQASWDVFRPGAGRRRMVVR